MRKESESSWPLYNFLVDDWFKTLLEKPIKEEEDMAVKNDQWDKEVI